LITNFLWQWEEKNDMDKMLANMKDYYKAKYQAIKAFGRVTVQSFESTNFLQEQHEVSQFFKEFRRDAMVNTKQINQMQQSFQGAADTMEETITRLKATLAEIKVLNKTIETLSDANKQLTTIVASLEKKVGMMVLHTNTQNANKEHEKGSKQDYETGKCPCCENIHHLPWKEHCWELKKNAHKHRPST